MTLEDKPPDATHWSLRSMAAASGVSRSSLQTIWRAFNHQPHRAETFKLSTDPRFVEKVLHFTPTSASWPNLVERAFADLTTKQLRRGVFRSVAAFERAARAYLDARNDDAGPFTRTADADTILGRAERNRAAISRSGH